MIIMNNKRWSDAERKEALSDKAALALVSRELMREEMQGY